MGIRRSFGSGVTQVSSNTETVRSAKSRSDYMKANDIFIRLHWGDDFFPLKSNIPRKNKAFDFLVPRGNCINFSQIHY